VSKIAVHTPSAASLERALERAQRASPSLVPTAKFEDAPEHFRFGRTRDLVGSGQADYEKACEVLATWEFLPRWAFVRPARAAQDAGETVLVVARVLGSWSVLPARIIQRVDGADPPQTGFVYSALRPHVAEGYERFAVSFDPVTQGVTFEIAAVARPVDPVLRRLRPFFTLVQRRFRRACMRQMRRQLAR
jgi:uncharacterized protein (UPF0548 family)